MTNIKLTTTINLCHNQLCHAFKNTKTTQATAAF